MSKKILFFLYLVLLTALSLWPSDGLPDIELFPYADKFIHAGMYAGFTFLMLWAWPQNFLGLKQFLPFLVVVAYGFFMETLQRISFLGRSFDLSDELANSLGFFPGWLFWKFVNYLKKSPNDLTQ
ncbi:MAG: VanZ family protein [Bacteroidales bacterium]